MERGQLHVDRPPGVFLRVVAGRESLREPPVQHLLLFPRRLRPRSTLHVARRPQLGAAGSHTHGTASSSPAAASSAEPGRQRPSSGSLPAAAPVFSVQTTTRHPRLHRQKTYEEDRDREERVPRGVEVPWRNIKVQSLKSGFKAKFRHFEDIRISIQHSAGIYAGNESDPLNDFDTILASESVTERPQNVQERIGTWFREASWPTGGQLDDADAGDRGRSVSTRRDAARRLHRRHDRPAHTTVTFPIAGRRGCPCMAPMSALQDR